MNYIEQTFFDVPEKPFKKHIKILMGGSPCTHWSIAQSKNRETTASGIGWELFENYLYARDKFKPDYFLYENNKSAAQPIKDQISRELGVNLQYINSALVSAQNRQRFYAHNVPFVSQPEDRGILLKNILDSGIAWNEKGYALTASYDGAVAWNTLERSQRTMVAEPLIFQTQRGNNKGGIKYGKCPTITANGAWADNNKVVEPIRIGTVENEATDNHDSKQYRVYSPEEKSTTLCGQGGGVGAKTGLYACPIGETKDGKAFALTSYYSTGQNPEHTLNKSLGSMVAESWDGKTYPVYEVKNGLIEIKGKIYPIRLPDGYYIIRKLTVNECRKLQTIPEWYKMPCSNSQNYKMLGNGWTVEVIKHILSYIPNIADCTIEVLSMYDGMSCGQISLTELGCKIERYESYEIDKYCIQTTQANFPSTIQRGDAFAVRERL